MLLVWYKREFEWSDVLRLWEALWTDYLSSQFHLFVAVAILEKHRDVIMGHLRHFDELLKYVNELSGRIDLGSTLVRAEGLFRRFEKTIEAVDRKESFPGPREKERVGVRNGEEKGKGKSQSPGRGGAGSSTSAREAGASTSTSGSGSGADKNLKVAKEQQQQPPQVISPELRALLSRKVVVLDQDEDEDKHRAKDTRVVIASGSGSGSGSGSAR